MSRGQFSISRRQLFRLWCSAHLFFYTAQIKPLVEQPASLDPSASLGAILPSLVLFALTYFGLNSWLITFVIAIEKRENPWRIWRSSFILASR